MKKPKVEIWYELETRCNLHCKFCFNFWKDGISSAPRRLSTEDALESLKQLFNAVECERISISGGEPLLREDLYTILSFIKSNGIPMVLTTNSTLLTRQSILKLMDSGIVTFQIPFHSTDQALHDMLSGGECWRDTLKAFIALKESGATVIAVFVATLLNLHEFCGVMEICSLLGIRELIFNRFVPSGLGLRNRHLIGVPDENSLIPILVEANKKAKELDQFVYLGMPIDMPRELQHRFDRISIASCPIRLAQTRWTIDAAGNIRRCNHSGAIVGNLLHGGVEKLLSELHNGPVIAVKKKEIQTCQILGDSQLVQIRPH